MGLDLEYLCGNNSYNSYNWIKSNENINFSGASQKFSVAYKLDKSF